MGKFSILLLLLVLAHGRAQFLRETFSKNRGQNSATAFCIGWCYYGGTVFNRSLRFDKYSNRIPRECTTCENLVGVFRIAGFAADDNTFGHLNPTTNSRRAFADGSIALASPLPVADVTARLQSVCVRLLLTTSMCLIIAQSLIITVAHDISQYVSVMSAPLKTKHVSVNPIGVVYVSGYLQPYSRNKSAASFFSHLVMQTIWGVESDPLVCCLMKRQEDWHTPLASRLFFLHSWLRSWLLPFAPECPSPQQDLAAKGRRID